LFSHTFSPLNLHHAHSKLYAISLTFMGSYLTKSTQPLLRFELKAPTWTQPASGTQKSARNLWLVLLSTSQKRSCHKLGGNM